MLREFEFMLDCTALQNLSREEDEILQSLLYYVSFFVDQFQIGFGIPELRMRK